MLLIAILFNIGGYVVIHQYMEYKVSRFFMSQTSKGLYNVNDLTEVKLPASLPGITDWKHYENISGQIQLASISYNYVKMKITKDAIYLMCIPNYKTTCLTDQNILQAKGMHGNPVPQKDHIPFVKGTIQYNANIVVVNFTLTIPNSILVRHFVQSAKQLIRRNLDIPEQPPRLFC